MASHQQTLIYQLCMDTPAIVPCHFHPRRHRLSESLWLLIHWHPDLLQVIFFFAQVHVQFNPL